MCNIVHILRLLGLRSRSASDGADKKPSHPRPKSSAPSSELVKAALLPTVGSAALFDTAVTLCTRAYNSLSKKKCVAPEIVFFFLAPAPGSSLHHVSCFGVCVVCVCVLLAALFLSRRHGSVRRRVTEELAQCYLSHGVCLARSPRMLQSDDVQRRAHQLLAKALNLYKDAGNRKQVRSVGSEVEVPITPHALAHPCAPVSVFSLSLAGGCMPLPTWSQLFPYRARCC